jgi:hypothetical protein
MQKPSSTTPAVSPICDLVQFLAYPFFSLKKSDKKPFCFSPRDGVKIGVYPGYWGRATIWDKELIVYAISVMEQRLRNGTLTPDTPCEAIVADANEMAHVVGIRETIRLGNRYFKLLQNAGRRLSTTSVETTVQFGGKAVSREIWETTTLCQSVKIARDKTSGTMLISIHLSDWVWRAIMYRERREVLTVNEYYQINCGLRRRLYEILRQQMGIHFTRTSRPKSEWIITLDRLRELCGSDAAPREFKRLLKAALRDSLLVHWRLSIVRDGTALLARNIHAKAVPAQSAKDLTSGERIVQ